MTKTISLVVLILCALSLAQAQRGVFDNIVVTEALKSVDIYTQLMYQDSFLTLKNVGGSSATEFYIAVENENAGKVALITVEDPEDGSEYKYTNAPNGLAPSNANATLWVVTFRTPLSSGASVKVKVSVTFHTRQEPLPKKITSLENQLAVLSDNSNLFTPYKVLDQNTEYKIPGTIKSKTGNGVESNNKVEYNDVADVQPFSRNLVRIHYVNNYPFAYFTEVVKTITVSHWGNIHISEEYKLENKGALFTGEFSRVDVNKGNSNSKNALKALNAKLPVHTWGLHYRDEIGNISTSNAYRNDDHVALTIRPRFWVFGGWKAFWDLTYNLPTQHYLYQEVEDSSRFTLKQKFGFPFESIMADNYTLKIVLPEGASDTKITLPFDVDGQGEETTFGMLDWEGRKTIVVTKRNLLSYHNKDFTISYTFNTLTILTEPIYLFGAFLVFFAILIVFGRLDLNFETKVKQA